MQTLFKPTLVALAILHTANSQAATIHVGGPLGRGCGLSAAILSANTDRAGSSRCIAGDGDDTIELHRDVTIMQPWQENNNGVREDTSSGTPLITSSITINGNGQAIRRGSSTPRFRLLRSQANSALALNDLKLINGRAVEEPFGYFGTTVGRGGAVLAEGDLTINNSRVAGNENAIFTYGDTEVRITDSAFVNNTGRGVVESSSVAPFYSRNNRFDGNTVSSRVVRVDNIYIERSNRRSEVSIIDTSITNNAAGGIDVGNAEEFVIDNTTVSNNDGSGIRILQSQGSIEDSTLSNNTAHSCAGLIVIASDTVFGVDTGDAPVSVSNSSITGNTAKQGDGGGVCSVASGNYGYALGNDFGLTIKSTTISGNSAQGNGGGLYSGRDVGLLGFIDAPITLINSTVSGNEASGSGGGIHIDGEVLIPGNYDYYELGRDSRITLVNSTVVENTAGRNGGGIEAKASYLNFINSIIAGNSSVGDGDELSASTPAEFTGAAALENSQNNLFGSSIITDAQAFYGFTPSSLDLTATSDGTIPTALESIILPLTNNGGSTLTHALASGSPAVNTADNQVCSDSLVDGLDQRGVERNDGQCDIGAYELETSNIDLPSISVANIQAVEGDEKVRVSIRLSEPQAERVRIDYQTVDGTANDGLDYIGRAGSMTFAPGQTQKIRTVTLLNDSLVEDTESFSFRLSNPIGAELGESVSQITVTDDDGEATVSIDPSTIRVDEGARSVTFRVTLSPAQTEKVSVSFRTSDRSATDGLDYVGRSGQMTFAAGQTSKIRAVKILQDDIAEPDENFRFILSDPIGARLGNVGASGRIIDDD